MQITLNQDEIIAALTAYVGKIINIAPGNEISIDLKAGRGENGYSATVDIVPASETEGQTAPIRIPQTLFVEKKPEPPVKFEASKPSKLEANYADEKAPVELPVEGEDLVDTKPVIKEDPAANQTQEEVEAEVEAFMTKGPSKSLFDKSNVTTE